MKIMCFRSVLPLLLFIFSISFLTSVEATTHTWLGGIGSWTQAANWDTGLVPTSGDKAIIPSGECRVKNGIVHIHDVEILAGATLKVAPTGILFFDFNTTGTAIDNSGTFLVFGSCVILNITKHIYIICFIIKILIHIFELYD